MSEMTPLQERLRTYGEAVDARRRPVDVDAILAGAVALPRRRVVRRRTPMLVLAAVAVLTAGLVVIVRPVDHPDDVRVNTPPPATSTPVATAPSATPPADGSAYVHLTTDGHWAVHADVRPAASADEPCLWSDGRGCGRIEYRVFRDGVEKASGTRDWSPGPPDAPLEPVGADGAAFMSIFWFKARPDVARVEIAVRLEDGRHVVDTLTPVDGFVVVIALTGGPSASTMSAVARDARAFASDGTRLG